jgi:hypothetical protein
MKRALWIGVPLMVALLAVGVGRLLTSRGSAGPEARAASDAAPPVAAAPAESAPTAPSPKVAPRAGDRPVLLETIGSLAAAHYFQTYLNIGFVADGKAKGTYTAKDASTVLTSLLSLVDSMDRNLEALEKLDLDPADRASLEQLRAASALLRQQGKELHTAWDSGKEEDAARYETLRQSSWATISKFMGISH